jgi:diguanylate cyclase (GGDEF)-like protein
VDEIRPARVDHGDRVELDSMLSSDADLQRLIHELPEPAIAIDDSGTIRWSNQVAKAAFRLATPDDVQRLIDPGSVEKLKRLLNRARSGEDVISELVFAIDGNPSLHSVHMFKLNDFVVMFARSSSEDSERYDKISSVLSDFATLHRESARQRSELEHQSHELMALTRELDGERRRLLSLIDQLPEAIVLVRDENGSNILTNMRVQELWRLEAPPIELEDLPLFDQHGDLIPFDDIPIMLAIRSGQDEGPFEYTIQAEDGAIIPIQVLASPVLDDDQQVIGAAMSIVDVSEQWRLREELEQQAVQDPLTGLGNRRKFSDQLDRALDQHGETDSTLAVLYVDLDGFKLINDRLGHDAGDEALRHVAARLKTCVRASDTIARIGGDEFAILFEHISGKAEVETIVQRILESLSETVEIEGELFRLPGSIGIVVLGPKETSTPADLIRRADMAMYQAKASGPSRWVYDDDLSVDDDLIPISLADEIHHALDTEQFQMMYRPVVDLETGRVREVDIALFWHHARDGLLDDDAIRARAWRAGVLHLIAERAASLAEHDRPLVLEAIRHRPGMVMCRHHWLEYLREERIVEPILQIAREIKNTPIRVRLELSGRLMHGDEPLLSNISRMRKAGIEFSLSHLGDLDGDIALLRHIPVSAIVVSPELVHDTVEHPHVRVVLSSLVQFAKSLNVPTKAPGVSTVEQLHIVKELGFELGAGDVFSPPLNMVQLLDKAIDRVFHPGSADIHTN